MSTFKRTAWNCKSEREPILLHNISDELCRLQDKLEACTYAEETEHVIKTFRSNCSFAELGMYMRKLEQVEERTRSLLSGKSPHAEPVRDALADLTKFRADCLDETRRQNFIEYTDQDRVESSERECSVELAAPD